MKRTSVFLSAMLFVLIGITSTSSAIEVVLFDQIFFRSTGAPVTVSKTFPALSGQATLRLTNGSAMDAKVGNISSATIMVNGVTVFDPSNFNQNVNQLVGTVNLNSGTNSLSVLLKSKPGGQIGIQIVQQVDAEGAGVIGPNGGDISVRDGASLLQGVKVQVPANALLGPALISISIQSSPPIISLPDEATSDGPCISFKSTDNNFQSPIYIMIPFAGERLEDEARFVYTFNESTDQWELVMPLATYDPSLFIAEVTHFSNYQKGRAVISGSDITASFQIGRDTAQYFNDNTVKCANDPKGGGICAGIAALSARYFNNWIEQTGESLMCRYIKVHSANISCEIFGDYLNAFKVNNSDDFWSKVFYFFWNLIPLVNSPDNSYVVDVVKRNAKNNVVTPLYIANSTWRYAHAVVAYGWHKTAPFVGTIKLYDVNHNFQGKEAVYLAGTMEYADFPHDFNIFRIDPIDPGIDGTIDTIIKRPLSDCPASAYQFITKWGSVGSGDGRFFEPRGVAVDSSRNVYVVDFGNNRIQKFDSNGTFITKWGSTGTGDGQFFSPSGVAVDSSGNVYVIDNISRIQKFHSNGAFITKWGSQGTGDGQFFNPGGVAVDSSGNVYVADMGRIQKFHSNGTFITKWGTQGINSRGMAVDLSGNVYVAYNDFPPNSTTPSPCIQKYDSNGTFITKWGSSGSGDGRFFEPSGVAVDSSGNVYVVDMGHIQKFDSNGTFITKWGSVGSGDGQFIQPSGVAVDSSGNVYVVDYYLNRILKFGR